MFTLKFLHLGGHGFHKLRLAGLKSIKDAPEKNAGWKVRGILQAKVNHAVENFGGIAEKSLGRSIQGATPDGQSLFQTEQIVIEFGVLDLSSGGWRAAFDFRVFCKCRKEISGHPIRDAPEIRLREVIGMRG
jgi:hypothetical protein